MNGIRDELRDIIEEIAQIVRNNLGLSIPIDMIRVVEQLGGKCVPIATTDYDAKIQTTSDNGFEIRYAENQSMERIQFSIAHELGHLFLHILQSDGRLNPESAYYRGKENTRTSAELEANEFAASLLMPKDEFTQFCMAERSSTNDVDLKRVAEHFKVSKQAANVRGSILNLW